MTNFNKGDLVNFNRNALINANNIEIIAVVEKMREEFPQTYIIEHSSGWIPNSARIAKFGLYINKRYLFVQEDELVLIQ